MGAVAQGLAQNLSTGYQSGVKAFDWFEGMMGSTSFSVQLRLNKWQEKNWGEFRGVVGLRLERFGLIVILVGIGMRRI